MRRIHFDIDDKLGEQMDQVLTQQNLTVKQFGTEALVNQILHPKKGKKGLTLMRSPIDQQCMGANCPDPHIPFGGWCYYHPEHGSLCLNCGTDRGWKPKDRVKKIIANRELALDRKALNDEIKVLADRLMELQRKISIYSLGQEHGRLEELKADLITQSLSYLRGDAGAVPEKEREAFQKLLDLINKAEKIEDEIESKVFQRLADLKKEKDRKQQKKKKKRQEIAE